MKDKEKQKLTFEQECSLIANGEDLPQEKQIEEMSRLIKLPIENWLEDTDAIPQATTYYAELMGCINDSAEVLFNENYRKIDKDSVVLSKSELGEIKNIEKNYYKNVVIPQARKETAEKFANELKEIAKLKLKQFGMQVVDIDDIDKVANQLGVEL